MRRLVFAGRLGFGALTVLLVSGGLYLIESLRFLQPILMIGGGAGIAAASLLGGVRPASNRVLVGLFGLMGFLLTVIVISSVSNGDWRALVDGVGFVVMATLIILASNSFGERMSIYTATLWAHVPLMLVSVVGGDLSTPHQGIFYNPNSMGTMAATLSVAYMAVFLGKVYRRSPHSWSSAFGFALAFLLVLASMSRTSFLSVIGTGAVLGLRLALASRTRVNARIVRVFGLVVLAGALLTAIQGDVINKFIVKSARGDVWDNRLDVWGYALQNAGLWGGGASYFSFAAAGAHNTYISVLGKYGWPAGVMHALLYVVGLRAAWNYAQKSKYHTEFSVLPLALITVHMLLSVGEVMFMKTSMYLCFVSMGMVLRNAGDSGMGIAYGSKGPHRPECRPTRAP